MVSVAPPKNTLPGTAVEADLAGMDCRAKQDGGQSEEQPPALGDCSDEASDDEDSEDGSGVELVTGSRHRERLSGLS